MKYELEELTKAEAFDELKEMSGRSFYLPGKADEVLSPFADEVTDEFLARFDSEDFPELVFHEAIKAEQAFPGEKGGIATVPDYQPIISADEMSGLLVEALGGERSSGMSIGRGSSADEAHRDHIKFIEENVELDREPAEA